MTAAAPAAPTRRIAPSVARAAVFGAALAVAWWLGTAAAGADPSGGAAEPSVPPDPAADLAALADLLPENSIVFGPASPTVPAVPAPVVEAPDGEAQDGGAPQVEPAGELMDLVGATVAPLLAPSPVPAAMPAPALVPAGTRSPAATSVASSAAAPMYAAVAPVVEPLTRSVLKPVVPHLVDPVVRQLVGPVARPAANALAAIGFAAGTGPAAGEGLVPTAVELAPGPLLDAPVAPAIVPVAPAAPPAPAPLATGPAPALRSDRAPVGVRTADHTVAPTAPLVVDVAAAPVAPAAPDDRPGPRPVARRLPWATGPSGAGGPVTGSRDLPDRAHGAVADAMASARLATPAERAPVTPAGVGSSVNAASRPAVTPD